MKTDRDVLPLVLFELSVMRQTVRGFRSDAEEDAVRLLAQLALIESKAWRLMRVRKTNSRRPHEH